MSNRNWLSGSPGLDHQGPSQETSDFSRHDHCHQQYNDRHDQHDHHDNHDHHEQSYRASHDDHGLNDSGGDRLIHDGGNWGDHTTGDAHAMHHAGAELGWGEAAWGDAGGFEAVPIGDLHGAVPFGGNLEIDNNTFIQNTAIDNTSILFDAANGGRVEVAGNVTAMPLQQIESEFQGMSGTSHSSESGMLGQFGGGFFPGSGGAIVIVPVDHLEINNNTYVQNTLVENTMLDLNASNGGTIDIGGSVNALGSQAILPASDVHHLA
jgi:hypothetical protein